VPQDIPLEASETLAFTPPSLAQMDSPPVLVIRTATTREKRFHLRLMREESLRSHGKESLRAEILTGLKALWSPEAFAEHEPTIKTYWAALDNHELNLKLDPETVWQYDPDIERAVDELVERVRDAWPPLGRMLADNADTADMAFPLLIAVMLKSWKNLDARFEMDRGYLTLDSVDAVRVALERIEKAEGVPKGSAFAELAIACSQRMYLAEEEAKNSASPSPSDSTLEVSSETDTSEEDGKSPASARSKKTPESA
jgi:hypothetical protein